jgi:hypothetical protein
MVGPAILLLCASIATSDKEASTACSHAFNAGVSHTGHDKKINKYAKSKERSIREAVGDDVSLGAAAIYTFAIKQEASFRIYKFSNSESAVIKLNPREVNITLNWRF